MTALGRSGLRVSRLALGSRRTYERISRDQGIGVSANLGALALADRLTPDERDRLAAIGVP